MNNATTSDAIADAMPTVATCVHRGSQRHCCAELYVCRHFKMVSCVPDVSTFVQLRNRVPAEQREQFDVGVLCCASCTDRDAVGGGS